jgi:glutaredoxin
MIEVYTMRNCEHCKQAKQYLQSKGVSFKEVDMSIGGNPETQHIKKRFKEMGLKSYPVIAKGRKVLLSGFDRKEYDMLFGE